MLSTPKKPTPTFYVPKSGSTIGRPVIDVPNSHKTTTTNPYTGPYTTPATIAPHQTVQQ
jgi:hypothetical protein